MESDLQSRLPGVLGKLPEVDPGQMNTIYESRAEALLAVDEMIGHVLDELEAQRVLDNTFVFFASDNGYHLGARRAPALARALDGIRWLPLSTGCT